MKNKFNNTVEKLLCENTGKLPPQAIDLEEAVLGSLLIDSKIVGIVTEILKPECFYSLAHQSIYEVIYELHKNKLPIDMLTVKDELSKIKKLSEVGGPAYIVKLTTKVASSAHAEYHSYIIKQKFTLRELIRISNETANNAYNDEFDLDDQIDQLTKSIERIGENRLSKINETTLLQNEIKNSELIQAPPVAVNIIETDATQTVYKRLFTLGNFSAIIGKAKSRKTFFLSLIVSILLCIRNIHNKFLNELPENKKLILWFDTEQGAFDSQAVVKRIFKMVGSEDNFKFYNLRPYAPLERCKIIDFAFKKYGEQTGYCVIDGIADLACAINDEVEASRVSTLLLQWTANYKLHISTIIHQNKNDNFATGHLGSSVMKKAETVISVSKEGDDTIVKCDYSRGRMFKDFFFAIDGDGIPYIKDGEKSEVKQFYNDIKENIIDDLPF